MATVARQKLDAGEGNAAQLQSKQFSAQFYFDKVLPETEALLRDILSGKGDMMDLQENYWAA